MWRPHFYTVGHSCTAISLSSTYPEYLTLTVFLSPPHTPSHRPVFFSFQPFTHLLLHPGSHHLEPQPVHLRYLTSATNFLFYHFQSQTLAKPIVWFHQHLKQHLTFLTWQILSQSMSLFLSLPPFLSGPPAHSTTSTNTTYFPLSLLTEMRQHTMTETLIIGTKRRWYVQLWKRVLERRGCRQRGRIQTQEIKPDPNSHSSNCGKPRHVPAHGLFTMRFISLWGSDQMPQETWMIVSSNSLGTP